MKKLHGVLLASTIFATSAFSTTSAIAAHHNVKVTELADGLAHPWGMTFLPDGDMLITERDGFVRRYSASSGLSKRLSGSPTVVAKNQGGMLDIILDPDFAQNNTVYMCYSRPEGDVSSSAVAKAVLGDKGFTYTTDIFVSDRKLDNGFHFGCRLAFDANKHLYAALGDRYVLMKEAQDTDNHAGKIVRITTNGDPIADNPFISGNAPEVFTYGHRNIQGLTVHPDTGDIWAMEHGPKGGDEVNLIEKGNNYGWPAITYGIDYDDDIISDKTEMEGMEQPVLHWTPSIAPSGMVFYNGDVFKEWRGDLLVGSLKFRHLRRVEMNGSTPGEQHEYLKDRDGRIRDVEVGPDGLIYVLVDDDDGKLLQLSPE